MKKQSVELVSGYLFVKAVYEGEAPLTWEQLLHRADMLGAVRGESSAEFLQINVHLIPHDCVGSYIIFLNTQRTPRESRGGAQVLGLALQYVGGKKVCVRRWLTIGTRKWGKNILLPQRT